MSVGTLVEGNGAEKKTWKTLGYLDTSNKYHTFISFHLYVFVYI